MKQRWQQRCVGKENRRSGVSIAISSSARNTSVADWMTTKKRKGKKQVVD